MFEKIPNLLFRSEVEQVVQLEKSTINALIRVDEFPTQLKLGRRRIAWLEQDIATLIAEKARERFDGRAAR